MRNSWLPTMPWLRLLALNSVAAFAVCVCCVSNAAEDPLPSWNDGPPKNAILEFVADVADRNGKDYVKPAERIAVFDNDGTLWVEQPIYTQVTFIFDRVKELAPQHPEWKTTQPFKALLEGDMKTVAASGEKGILQMGMATHAGKAVREAVLAAAGELEKLAAVVKSGAVKSVEEPDAAFARAHHALASHHCLRASEAWAKVESRKAGHALHAAACYVDGGLKCVGHRVEEGTAKTLEGARHLAGKLIAGSGKFGEEVGRSIEDCGKHTEALGEKIAAPK